MRSSGWTLLGGNSGGTLSLSRAQDNPLGTVKLMITGQRQPLSAVFMRFPDSPDSWWPTTRSGDGFWQPHGIGAQSIHSKIDVKVGHA